MSLHADSDAPLASRFPAPRWRTRFAPAPTGYLHLGHVVNAVYVWGVARAFGGQVVLRIEDHDRTRCRPEYERALLDDLEWLGFEPDVGSIAAFRSGATPFRQADNSAAYLRALQQLDEAGRVYPCVCSRRDVMAIVGESPPGEETCYPGSCRARALAPEETRARRVRLDDRTVSFHDLQLGAHTQHPARQCGDLLVRDRFGHWTYQFAVTVDDRDQGIDVVIRGEDLLRSTGRQLLVAEMLGRESPPLLLHHPLVTDATGRKLSKSSNDTAVQELRRAGITASALIGEAAFRVGLQREPAPLAASAVHTLFQPR